MIPFLEITIVEAAANRVVKIQVDPYIPVGILVQGLIKGFECPKYAPPCYLGKGHEKLLGPNEYWMNWGVHQYDPMLLLPDTRWVVSCVEIMAGQW